MSETAVKPQMLAIKVHQDTKDLMALAKKKVSVDTEGEISTINDGITYILQRYLDDDTVKGGAKEPHWSES